MLQSATTLIVIKLLLAMLCGGAIGLERELSRKPAGLRTNVLICIGAALFMIVSRNIGGGAAYTDPARLVAQVVTGVGFIGAGVIIQARGAVMGLTTAATIFVVCSVGIAIGDGMYSAAIAATVLIIFVLTILRPLERSVIRRRRLFHYSLRTTDTSTTLERLFDLIEQEKLRLDDFAIRDATDGEHEINFSVVNSLRGNSRLVKSLRELGRAISARMGE